MASFKALRVFEDESGISSAITPLDLEDLPPGEVLIKAEYSSLNYKDALAITGRGKIMRQLPLNAGIDVSGTVVSSKDEGIAENTKVLVNGCGLGESHDGGYSEYVRVPASWVVPVPEGMTTLQAMQIGTAGFTAALAIDRMEQNGQDPAGRAIAVTGATGGVGSYAIDLLAGKGYLVTAITSKHQHADYLKELGATEVWNRSTISMNTRPLERAEWGGAIDNLGGDMLAWLLRTVEPWGNVASIGLAQSPDLNGTVMPFILRGVSLLGISSSNCPMAKRVKIWQRLSEDLKPRKASEISQKIISLEETLSVATDMLDGKISGRYIVSLDS